MCRISAHCEIAPGSLPATKQKKARNAARRQFRVPIVSSSAEECLLNEHDLARRLRISVATVRRWRLLRQGPEYVKLGGSVRYKPETILLWVESCATGEVLNNSGKTAADGRL